MPGAGFPGQGRRQDGGQGQWPARLLEQPGERDRAASFWNQAKLEEKAGHVCWTQGMLVEEAFKAADDRVCFGVAWEALCERCVTHILGLDQGKNDEREKLDLALPVLRKVVGEIQTESNEFSV